MKKDFKWFQLISLEYWILMILNRILWLKSQSGLRVNKLTQQYVKAVGSLNIRNSTTIIYTKNDNQLTQKLFQLQLHLSFFFLPNSATYQYSTRALRFLGRIELPNFWEPPPEVRWFGIRERNSQKYVRHKRYFDIPSRRPNSTMRRRCSRT